MTKKERAKLIKQYATGYDEVMRALERFPAGKLTARPFRGKWTAAEIVHHLADSEMTAAIRLRRLLVEVGPVILATTRRRSPVACVTRNGTSLPRSRLFVARARPACSSSTR